MDNGNIEKALSTADTAEAEKSEITATGLGKFKDVEALLNAYHNLEAEFTRRSQRLKELEKESNAHANPEGAPSPEGINPAIDAKTRDAVIGEYLKTVSEQKSVPLISGGVSAQAPRSVPASIKEAGALAQNFLNGNK